jgi:hypothetical protein
MRCKGIIHSRLTWPQSIYTLKLNINPKIALRLLEIDLRRRTSQEVLESIRDVEPTLRGYCGSLGGAGKRRAVPCFAH